MSEFDYENPEQALSDMRAKEDARREEVRAKSRIPDEYDMDSRVSEVLRGISGKGDPKWMFEVSLRDNGKPWHKAKRTLHFSEGSDWLMGRFWDIVKAWGINPAWVPAALRALPDYDNMDATERKEAAVGILMGFIEDAIEAGAMLPLVTQHKPDNRDPKKTQVNFMERLEDIPVVFDEVPQDDGSQEVDPETVIRDPEPDPEPEEKPVEAPAAEKPARAKPRSPYAKRPSTAV